MKYNYTKEEVQLAANKSNSYASLMRELGIKSGGGTQARLKKFVLDNEIDTSHFTGQAWRKHSFSFEWMKKDFPYRSDYRFSLIYLRGNKCECCGTETWLNKPITLEVHHIDNNKSNNLDDNLQLLCPNCHSYTESWRKPKNEVNQKIIKNTVVEPENKVFYCSKCGTERNKHSQSGLCRDCYNEQQQIVSRPNAKTLAQEIVDTSFVAVGRKYGVSDNAIRKWCVAYNIPKTKKELSIWLASNKTE